MPGGAITQVGESLRQQRGSSSSGAAAAVQQQRCSSSGAAAAGQQQRGSSGGAAAGQQRGRSGRLGRIGCSGCSAHSAAAHVVAPRRLLQERALWRLHARLHPPPPRPVARRSARHVARCCSPHVPPAPLHSLSVTSARRRTTKARRVAVPHRQAATGNLTGKCWAAAPGPQAPAPSTPPALATSARAQPPRPRAAAARHSCCSPTTA
eukprot:scaffold112195_cov75-Phaeocystis_antarctica.AAC.2